MEGEDGSVGRGARGARGATEVAGLAAVDAAGLAAVDGAERDEALRGISAEDDGSETSCSNAMAELGAIKWAVQQDKIQDCRQAPLARRR